MDNTGDSGSPARGSIPFEAVNKTWKDTRVVIGYLFFSTNDICPENISSRQYDRSILLVQELAAINEVMTEGTVYKK